MPKLTMQRMSLPSAIFYQGIGSLIVALPVLFFMKGKLAKGREGIVMTGTASIANFIAVLGYYYALHLGPTVTIVTITAMYPVVSLLLAHFIIKEKINRMQLAAICMAMVAIWVLAG